MGECDAARLRRLYDAWDEATLPPGAVASAVMGIVDAAGCIVGGAPTPAATVVRELAREQGERPSATVLGTKLRLAPALAALANGVAGHALDYDDMNSTLVGHPSVVLVPAIFALGEARGSSGRNVVSAYLLGFEVGACFARAMVPRHYDLGWHSTSTIGVLSAAAACSRLLGLDGEGMVRALSIAASTAAGLRANFGTATKSLHAGQAAEWGVRAAQLAARGFTGNPGVFGAAGGFLAAYGANDLARPDPGMLEIEASGIGIKPYACCGAGVSVIDAALDLRAAHEITAADIASVDLVVSAMATRIMPFHLANDGNEAKYSLAYCGAVALLDRAGGLAQFDDGRVARPDVRDLVERTTVRASPEMASGEGRFGVLLSVLLRDGRRLEASVELPRGHPRRRLGAAQLGEKFRECAGPVLGDSRAESAVIALELLADASDIRPLIALLRKD